MAQRAGTDVITHVPLDRALDNAAATVAATQGRVAVPTLSMMEAIMTRIGRPGMSYTAARASVAALHRAGVPVLAGTDANAAPGAPASVPYGEGLHRELELLVEAGLSTVEALRAATVLAARYFNLGHRGAIETGLRADLVLLDGDPLVDIRATRRIRRVWCHGVEYVPPPVTERA
jgi:imidazolonepropionase-like amidohydrolase